MLPAWRTPAFVSQRLDLVQGDNYVDQVTGKNYGHEVYFTYLKLTTYPAARLEFPGWVWRAGLLERMVDWIRAEVIIGSGYPYALQAADAAAVIGVEDRERYLRALEEFGQRHGIRTIRVSAKQVSKERRRA